MRTLMAVIAAVALVLTLQPTRPAQAGTDPILRKNNDAGASSTVITKDEPPLSAMPAPHEINKPVGGQNGKTGQ